jgi:hypothetical protein
MIHITDLSLTHNGIYIPIEVNKMLLFLKCLQGKAAAKGQGPKDNTTKGTYSYEIYEHGWAVHEARYNTAEV